MRFSPVALITLLAACGGSQPAAKAPPPPAPAPTAYKDMNLDQRKEFMEKVVLPEMKTAFAAFEPKFADMNCKSCHGKGAEDGSFEMPSAELPVLPNTPEKFAEYAKDPEHARWSKFMVEEVEPKMANLLHLTPFDPATKTGEFSCMSCHTTEK
jgi:hypothetical protein